MPEPFFLFFGPLLRRLKCPGGAYYWAPEIPSGARLAAATLR
jgi:hypothetical protein